MACSACFTGGTHDFAEPQGHLETVYGLNTYVTGDEDATSSSVILYLPDLFSLKLVNNKLLADRYAKGTGCKVLFPDIVTNGGADPAQMPNMEILMNQQASIFAKVQAFIYLIPTIYRHMIVSTAAKTFPEVLKYARAIRKDLPAGAKLGVAGFCWGGYESTNLCSEPAVGGGSERLIDAQFCGHPSRVEPQQFMDAVAKFKVSYACAVAEKDFGFNAEEARKVEATLREKVGPAQENNYDFRIYEGANHGFCVRAKPGVKEEMEGYEQAVKQAVDWFNRYLR